MEENKDLHEEKLNVSEENTSEETQNINIDNEENLTKEPTTEELLAEEKDRYIRLYAEFENYKKRTSKERMEFFQYANQDMMVSMLAILDDFERALKEIAKTGKEEDLKGVELIYQKFKNKLVEKGLKPIEVNAGDEFNVDFHEAITQIPAPTEDLKGKIVDVIESGYMLHDRVIRFTKVVTGQ
ncbi:nucleotide exchange factor GrpE [Riemerella anatipestifer]|uniref:Protein GrpE n=1 Tax=Riemerella anatipestifer TaxID=34085 RepID=A0AAP6LL02_RIEAN|nr:nucleotide exchange factor GrpE [Riemerella anatipestifer]MBT0549094.1 nucleotide exchange factor GrpE [Riemerella anatipestifer]MBT0556091.1 nucleotide exchange factor GrpE [Riemerella anatipestifer]MBT0559857.1 nucleotide exchange factor GrpE [Riemerella anatipestifer]MCD5969083.1 nucleotide exchange factor GrpE [Riemerella anatipestifer]MCO7354476.1 nucleotide exchange factor GrpE [Riemerella anatipestifer]